MLRQVLTNEPAKRTSSVVTKCLNSPREGQRGDNSLARGLASTDYYYWLVWVGDKHVRSVETGAEYTTKYQCGRSAFP
jgi:hypothetical protein